MKYKESETIELKKSTSELKEAIISMVAILNKHNGGELYFGIKDDGRVVGQDAGNRTLRDISRAISEKIEPKIYPGIRLLKLDGKVCIKITFKGKNTPYFASGRAYIRVADENRQMSARALENLIVKKNKNKLRWDKEACPQAKVADISAKKLKAFLKIAGLKYDTALNALAKLKILSGRKLMNAAVILFAKTPQKFFPNAKLRCAVFAREDTALIIDRKEFEGDIFYLIEKAQEYIMEHLHIGMRVEGLYRIDVPEIDKEAFREAIINAFCHRDYREYDSVNIAIFKDRLEIRSPGLLYGGLTIEKIRTESVLERRNELIAGLFHRIHIVEKWGRGISLILSKEPAAVFKEVGRQFIVVFTRKKTAENTVRKKVVEKVVEKVTENQKKILDEIRGNKFITAKKLSEIIEISERKIQENIKKLKQKKLLKRIGPDKGGHWKVKI
ncbi:MAG: ATP-binding protein [Elusimicrobiota bacterium]|nr:ATP-binding protein [Elusimicrobiota bacterium]